MKREMDNAIFEDLKTASDTARTLWSQHQKRGTDAAQLSADSDSFADNIKMLDVSEIMPNKDNFYSMNDIELLAEDIERQDLKHNLVVAKDKDSGKYWLISGHRRLEAVKFLINEGRRSCTKVPCYINGEKTQAESRLDLIMLNATQRKYTDQEIMVEYEQLTETLKQLEVEGKKISGRIRDVISKVLNVSKSQVGKIDNIKHNAVPAVEQAVKSGKMSISTANEVARLAPEKQKDIAEQKPEISHKEVKEKLKTSPPPSAPTKKPPTAPTVKPTVAKAEDNKPVSPALSAGGNTVEQTKPRYAPCTLSESETEVLSRYIEQLVKIASKDDITVINGIKARLIKA